VSVAAFLDANVLYPATLRSVLVELARAKAFRLLWSEEVHREWMEAVKRQNPHIPASKIDRMRALMEAYVEDATVSGYEPLIASLSLPDPNDRHVLAAAIHGKADVIVTANERDFPATALAVYKIAIITPDRFIIRLLEADPNLVLSALEADRADLKNPPLSRDEYFGALERCGLIEATATLRILAASIPDQKE
jgi:predicted nucleic acid-binding protein